MNQYLSNGVINPSQGLGLLKNREIIAEKNETGSPSLTAACHITIGTSSKSARNDIVVNSFYLVASPFNQNISGFAAPIGGYSIGQDGASESANPTAEPIGIKNG